MRRLLTATASKTSIDEVGVILRKATYADLDEVMTGQHEFEATGREAGCAEEIFCSDFW